MDQELNCERQLVKFSFLIVFLYRVRIELLFCCIGHT